MKAAFTVAAITGFTCLAGTAWAAKAPIAEREIIITPKADSAGRNAAEEYLMLAALLGLNCMGAFALYKSFTGAKDPVI